MKYYGDVAHTNLVETFVFWSFSLLWLKCLYHCNEIIADLKRQWYDDVI